MSMSQTASTPTLIPIYNCECGRVISLSTQVNTQQRNVNIDKEGFEGYTYIGCKCGIVHQINPYKVNFINKEIMDAIQEHSPLLRSKHRRLLPNELLELDISIDNLELVKFTDINDIMPFLESGIYALGDAEALEMCLEFTNQIKYEKKYKKKYVRHTTDMYIIKSKPDCGHNIIFGIIGTEVPLDAPDTMWLSWTYIINDFKGRKVGSSALTLIERLLINKGITKLYVEAEGPAYSKSKDKNSKEASQVQRFYENNGFVVDKDNPTSKEYRKAHPELKVYLHYFDDDIIMCKDLVKLDDI